MENQDWVPGVVAEEPRKAPPLIKVNGEAKAVHGVGVGTADQPPVLYRPDVGWFPCQISNKACEDTAEVTAARKSLENQLEKLLRLRWTYRQLNIYYDRLQFGFQVIMALTSFAPAALHSIFTETATPHSRSIVAAISGVHAAAVGLYGTLRLGNIAGECNSAAKGYDSLVQQMRASICKCRTMQEFTDAERDIHKAIQMVMHACSTQPPEWVMDAASHVDPKTLHGMG